MIVGDHSRQRETHVSITSKTDILLGVSMAADPAKYKEAVSRLRQLAPQSGEFAAMLDGRSPAARGTSPGNGVADQARGMPEPISADIGSDVAGGVKDIFTKLEAFIMQTFVQSMLPKDAPSVYGKGTAGDVWKSMMAEKIGAEVARSGQLGIAKRLSSSNITTGAIARTAPVGSLLPASVTMPSLVAQRPASAPAGLAKALSHLQETQAAQTVAKVPNAWVTTVHKEQA